MISVTAGPADEPCGSGAERAATWRCVNFGGARPSGACLLALAAGAAIRPRAEERAYQRQPRAVGCGAKLGQQRCTWSEV